MEVRIAHEDINSIQVPLVNVGLTLSFFCCRLHTFHVASAFTLFSFFPSVLCPSMAYLFFCIVQCNPFLPGLTVSSSFSFSVHTVCSFSFSLSFDDSPFPIGFFLRNLKCCNVSSFRSSHSRVQTMLFLSQRSSWITLCTLANKLERGM